MTPLHLVMPMAGRGSRFERNGFSVPKPLIDLQGLPFYVWAVESLASKVEIGEMVFVVLQEHIDRHGIDGDILGRYPRAHVVAIPDVTSGAAETAAVGLAELKAAGPVAVNDCDHAFDATGIDSMVERLQDKSFEGALLGFEATSPAFSYVRLDAEQRVVGTVEKEAVSPYAIAGCYLLAEAAAFGRHYDAYRAHCTYAELFMSGIYNQIIDAGGAVGFHELVRHVAFGTPEELARVDADAPAAVTEGASGRGQG